MYSATVTYLNSYEYFEIDKFDNESSLNVRKETFCPMCDEFHSGSYCQMNDIENGESL